MNIRNNPGLRDKLAAEYALGTLKGAARRRFESWLHDDADLRNIAAAWSARLMPLAEFTPPARPSKQVWKGIESRLKLQPAKSGWLSGWLGENLAFWRTLGLASTAMATLLVAVLVSKSLEPVVPVVSYVAALNDEKSGAAVLVAADTTNRTMRIRVVGGAPVPDQKTLQLWAVPKQGAPRSLGLIAAGATQLTLPANAISADVALLAVSLEPSGGSPDPNGPTGPILYKGPWMRI